MKTSEQINELNAALAQARAKFPTIDKGRTADTGKFAYDYADLADIFEATAKPLAEHGLTLWQDVWAIREPLAAVVQTRLDHASGQFRELTPMEIPCVSDGKMGPAQLIGSAETYGRRYQALAILGVQPRGEDDDGHAASGTTADTSKRDALPDCPSCKNNKSVIIGKPEFGGGFVCFAKKGGCGAKWQSGEEDRPIRGHDEKPNGKAKEIASEHGLKTGDQIAPPSAAYKKALAKIDDAVKNRDPVEVTRILGVAQTAHKDNKMPEHEFNGIANECTVALKKIRALENEPSAA